VSAPPGSSPTPSDVVSSQAATKLIYLAIERAETRRSVRGWTSALAALKIHFGDQLPD
jgi:transposase-like protein